MNNYSYKKAVDDLKFVYSENNTLSIIFKNNDILMGVVGEFNNNLKDLEKITDTSIYSRGNSILVKSNQKKNENFIQDSILNKYQDEPITISETIQNNFFVSTLSKIEINNKDIRFIVVSEQANEILNAVEERKDFAPVTSSK